MRYLDVGIAEKISKIGLGTWQFGATEWGYGEPFAENVANVIVRRALELGVTLFDTAEIYGSGRSEEILGQALGKHRESVFVATKMFPIVPSAFVLRQRAVASTRRIGTLRLGLYQVHYPNPLVSDRTLMRGMRSLQQAGVIAEVGVSNYSLARWRAAEKSLGSRILSNQVEYSLIHRSPEHELLPYAESHDRVIIAFSPLAMGLLSGKYHGTAPPANLVRAANPRFGPEYLTRTSELIAVLREVADAHSASPAQIALAWVIHSPAVVAIPGAASVEQLESNVAAAEITLADDEYLALRQASGRLGDGPTLPTPGSLDTPESGPSARFAVRHSLRCGWYVAKTIWRDHAHRSASKLAPIAVCDYTKRIMQAEPLAKILRQPDLTRPVRDECDLRECSSGKRENCLLVDSVADNVKFYHVAWIFLVDDPAHSTQPGPQPAYVVTLG